jgi:hypothetical protein
LIDLEVALVVLMVTEKEALDAANDAEPDERPRWFESRCGPPDRADTSMRT